MTWDALTLADWGGSVAAAISIVLLFRKSLWYWYFSIVATLLWFYVFLSTESAMVAGLQIFYTVFAVYGIARWYLQEHRRNVPGWLDHAGLGLAVLIFIFTVALTEFVDWPSYVEFSAVALSILANWLTAMKVIWCWAVWISTNVLFATLFWHFELWGLFSMQFVYGALSVVGFLTWQRDKTRVFGDQPKELGAAA
jgi:nicotinamide mononucleotide transporter